MPQPESFLDSTHFTLTLNGNLEVYEDSTLFFESQTTGKYLCLENLAR